MGEIRSVRDLDAWKVATRAVELTYRLTAGFPDSERFGLVTQMRRAAVSIPSNLAEAQGVRTTRWALRHVVTAIGSSCELDAQLEIALRLNYLTADAASEVLSTLERTQKLLYGMRREKERRLLASAGAVTGTVLLLLLPLFR